MSVGYYKICAHGNIKPIDINSKKKDACMEKFKKENMLNFTFKINVTYEICELYKKVMKLLNGIFLKGEHYLAYQRYDKTECEYVMELYIFNQEENHIHYFKEILYIVQTCAKTASVFCDFDYSELESNLRVDFQNNDITNVFSNCSQILLGIDEIQGSVL